MATPPPNQHWTNWLCITIFFAVLFNYPLLQVFNRTTLIFGVPLLISFLLLGWLLFIWAIYRFSCRLPKGRGADDTGRDEEHKHP
jgi:hypothetical protein